MTNQRFPKSVRLLRSREFERVFAARCSASDGLLIAYGCLNDQDGPRLGLAVSQKAGNAVARNRWKRAIREAFRLSQCDLPALDLVCMPRPNAEPSVARLLVSLPALASEIERKLQRDPDATLAPGDSPGAK